MATAAPRQLTYREFVDTLEARLQWRTHHGVRGPSREAIYAVLVLLGFEGPTAPPIGGGE